MFLPTLRSISGVLVVLASTSGCSSSDATGQGTESGTGGAQTAGGGGANGGSTPGGGASASGGTAAPGTGGGSVTGGGGTVGGATSGSGGTTGSAGGTSNSGGGAPQGGDGAGGAATAATCPSTATAKPGEITVNLQSGGLARQYYLHVPASYTGKDVVPLVVDLHPFLNFLPGDAADSQRSGSGYRELSEKEGFLVAYPQGIDRAWNLGTCCTQSRTVDDVGFIKDLVARVKADACVDPKRVYATGYSNGGGLAHLLACRAADVFAAVAPASFDLVEQIMPCTPSRPIAELAFRGRTDTVVPYAGGTPPAPPSSYPLDPVTFLGAVGTFDKWSEIDGCTGDPESAPGDSTWTCQTRSHCKAGTTVTLCSGPGGHVQGSAPVAWTMMKTQSLP